MATPFVFHEGRVLRTCSISKKVPPRGVEEERGGDFFAFDFEPHSIGVRLLEIEVAGSLKTARPVLFSEYLRMALYWAENEYGVEVKLC